MHDFMCWYSVMTQVPLTYSTRQVLPYLSRLATAAVESTRHMYYT